MSRSSVISVIIADIGAALQRIYFKNQIRSSLLNMIIPTLIVFEYFNFTAPSMTIVELQTFLFLFYKYRNKYVQYLGGHL